MEAGRVSIIIPCYNAARWLHEAIDSCLAQTYCPVEIIVIDDGSTDDSLAIVQSYGAQIRYESGPNRGGNHARNRGFALSHGDYVQFLDADDYLLPNKIERQVEFLEEIGADVVYGDWRHQFHQPDGLVTLGEVVVSDEQPDVLEALLADWWVAPASLLFRHAAIERSGGWDETLQAAQDRDFFITVALSRADIRYQAGCQSVYRRYGNVTVSTSNRMCWLASHRYTLEKAELRLRTEARLSEQYRQALARSYFQLARNYYEIDRANYTALMSHVRALDPAFRPHESRLYNVVWHSLGSGAAERLAVWRRKVAPR